MKCAICGKEIDEGKETVDHIFPRAMYKWFAEYLQEEHNNRIKKIIEGPDNKAWVHHHCNIVKGEQIYKISTLYVSEQKKLKLYEVKELLGPVIKQYIRNKEKKLSEQSGKCFCCGRRISLRGGTVRRIDPNKKRIWENACIVCHYCNLRNKEFKSFRKSN